MTELLLAKTQDDTCPKIIPAVLSDKSINIKLEDQGNRYAINS